MSLKEIGFAVESTKGEGAETLKTTVTQLFQPITNTIEKILVMTARLDCPCCKKGITIKIDTKI